MPLLVKYNVIKDYLKASSVQLAAHSDTPQLDAELLLAKTLNVTRSYLLAWPEQALDTAQANTLAILVQRRAMGEPMAYILGYKEFWSLTLLVTSATLIPRPETELLVEIALAKLAADQALSVADLGTGSGAIALALAKERPQWQVVATDISSSSLKVAKTNARRLHIANVRFCLGDWCDALPNGKFAAIISNPPYISAQDSHLQRGDLRFEPTSALIANEQGMAALSCIIAQACRRLVSGGWLLLEHGCDQAQAVADLMKIYNYQFIEHACDLAGHQRITAGQWIACLAEPA